MIMRKIKCLICNNKTGKIISNYVYGGKKSQKFFECANCKLAILYPTLSENEEKLFYQKEFENFMDKRIGLNDTIWKSEDKIAEKNRENIYRRKKFLKKYLKNNSSILEIGCSSGFMLDELSTAQRKCYGIEPSNLFRKILKKKGYKIFNNINQIENINIDIIVHFFVFEHIVNPFKFLKDQLDLLNKKGKIIFEIPCYLDPLTTVYKNKAFEKFYWSVAHPYYYTPLSISKILKSFKNKINFKIYKDQRYDISNHLYWLLKGKPGGQSFFKFISKETINSYRKDLIQNNYFDTMFVVISK